MANPSLYTCGLIRSEHFDLLRSLQLRSILLIGHRQSPPSLNEETLYSRHAQEGPGSEGEAESVGQLPTTMASSAAGGTTSALLADQAKRLSSWARAHQIAFHALPFDNPAAEDVLVSPQPRLTLALARTRERALKVALELALDATAAPLLITDDGSGVALAVMLGCLRRLERWSLSSIVLEMSLFGPVPYLAQQYVELFDPDIVTLPKTLPDWFVRSMDMFDEEEEGEADKQAELLLLQQQPQDLRSVDWST